MGRRPRLAAKLPLITRSALSASLKLGVFSSRGFSALEGAVRRLEEDVAALRRVDVVERLFDAMDFSSSFFFFTAAVALRSAAAFSRAAFSRAAFSLAAFILAWRASSALRRRSAAVYRRLRCVACLLSRKGCRVMKKNK